MLAVHAERMASSEARPNLRIYAMDGALLGLFMVSACVSVVLAEHPSWNGWWIYLTAPVLGMLAGTELERARSDES